MLKRAPRPRSGYGTCSKSQKEKLRSRPHPDAGTHRGHPLHSPRRDKHGRQQGLRRPARLDNKGFVALLVFGIVGTVLGFYGSPLMWTRLATVNQELTVVQAVTQEHLYTVADLAQRLSVNGKTASATLNNCIRKGREPRPRPHAVHPRLLPLRRNGGTHQRRHRPLPLLRQRPLRPRQALTRPPRT